MFVIFRTLKILKVKNSSPNSSTLNPQATGGDCTGEGGSSW